jgi:flagellar motor protein MotB
MKARRALSGGQARHSDDWLMTYADTITLLLCLFVVLLALHGAKLHDAVPAAAASPFEAPRSFTVPQAPIVVVPFPELAAAPPAESPPAESPPAGSPRSFPVPQAPFVVGPFRELAGMPRPVRGSPADTDDDADDPTTQPNIPPARRAVVATGTSSARPVQVVSFVTLAFATPQPVPIVPPAVNAVAPAIPATPGDRTPRAADAATPPPQAAATPVSASVAVAPEQAGDRITIFQLSSAAFFASGTATLSDSGQFILASLLGRLQSPSFSAYRITVEGHTDDEPIRSSQFPSNWELSAARAAAVVRFFVEHGIPADRLRAAGYADTHPLAPNRDAAGDPIPENQAQNRRVVIELEKIDRAGT